MFLIDRAFAEQSAARFDSLTSCKALCYQYNEALEACKETEAHAGQTIAMQGQSIIILKQEKELMQGIINTKGSIIDILEKNHEITKDILWKANKKLKRQKFWGSFSGVLSGLAAGVLIGVLIK